VGFRLPPTLTRIASYLQNEPLQVVIDLIVIWVVVWLIVRFLRGTRGAGVIKGLALLLIVATLGLRVIGRGVVSDRLAYLYDNFLGFVALMLVVVFQPELRRALVRLGETRFFRQGGLRKARVVEELLEAIEYLSKNKIGMLVAIERQVGLRGVVEIGTRVDAEVSAELLKTIFWPGSALHDMGVVLRGDRVIAAGVQFPLAEGAYLPQELGSRHRAAIGLSQESDALVLVVSEETGTISVAERGELNRGLDLDQMRSILTRGMTQVTITAPAANAAESVDETEETATMTGKAA